MLSNRIHILVRCFFPKNPNQIFRVLQYAAACFKTPTNRPQKQVLQNASTIGACSLLLATAIEYHILTAVRIICEITVGLCPILRPPTHLGVWGGGGGWLVSHQGSRR